MNLRDGIWWTMDWDLSIYEHAAVAHALMAWQDVLGEHRDLLRGLQRGQGGPDPGGG